MRCRHGQAECMPSKRSAASRRRSTSVPVPAVSGVGGSLVERSRRSRRNFSCAPPRRDVRGCITRPFCDEHWLPIALVLGERPTASRRGLPAAYSVLYHRFGGRWGEGYSPQVNLLSRRYPGAHSQRASCFLCDRWFPMIALVLGERPTASRSRSASGLLCAVSQIRRQVGRGIQPSGQFI